MPAALEDVDYLDDLLLYIRAGRVVPIIGPELLTVEHDGAAVPLDRYLALRLADRLRVSRSSLPPDFTLTHVVAAYTSGRGRPGDVPPRLYTILAERAFPPPEALRKLARIRPLRLFVTTTFDSLLQQAIDEVRFGGALRTRQLAYAPNRVHDLDPAWASSDAPTVYHLLGQASAERNFVITDEDMLEFLHALQSESRRPTVLLDELDRHHLLFLGCRFPDWLARFVIRTTRRGALSPQRDQMEVVADRCAAEDASLSVFLDQFSFNTKLFPGSAAEFVDVLVARWQERYPDDVTDAPPSGAGQTTPVVASEPRPETVVSASATGVPNTAPNVPPNVAPNVAPNVLPSSTPDVALNAAPTRLPHPAPALAPAAEAGDDVAMRPGAVFVSYASEDRSSAERLCAELSTVVDVWLDKQELRGGSDWDMQIRQNIRQCALFVPIVSRQAASRSEGYFRREWLEALRRAEGIDQTLRTFLVPVAIDAIPNNALGIPPEFWARHVERFEGGVPSPAFRDHVRDLVRRFRLQR